MFLVCACPRLQYFYGPDNIIHFILQLFRLFAENCLWDHSFLFLSFYKVAYKNTGTKQLLLKLNSQIKTTPKKINRPTDYSSGPSASCLSCLTFGGPSRLNPADQREISLTKIFTLSFWLPSSTLLCY